MKIFFKVLTGLDCALLLIIGIVNLNMGYPIPLNLTNIAFIVIYSKSKMIFIIYIILSIFVLIKLFLSKQVLIHKIFSGILAICGILQIAFIVIYYTVYYFQDYLISDIYRNVFLILNQLTPILMGLLIILICINTFKPFINNKPALIICGSLFILKASVYFVEMLILNFVIFESSVYLNDTVSIYLSSLLIDIFFLWAGYIGLRTNDKSIKKIAGNRVA